MLYPLTFHPIFKVRPWGGRRLETLYRKPLPSGATIGESWEVSDRPGDESRVANGPLAGTSLRRLMEEYGAGMLGRATPAAGGRFPLLCKILDASDTLSLQVHPPDRIAAALGGEPKTEMWYVADARPGAEIFAGLRRGVTRAQFESKLAAGEVAECFHRIPVAAGGAMFLPSGRVHAIGAGLVIFEIQQNSDTTYRVFDWNRPGVDGTLRELHVPQSLASIDFADFEPALAATGAAGAVPGRQEIVRHALFTVTLHRAAAATTEAFPLGRPSVAAIVTGRASVSGAGESIDLAAGQFCLVPADTRDASLRLDEGAVALVATAGGGERGA